MSEALFWGVTFVAWTGGAAAWLWSIDRRLQKLERARGE